MSTPSPSRAGIEDRLSRMIQLQTVAGSRAPFEAFAALIASEYPLVHAHLALEAVGETGLLYRWSSGSDRPPAVLMAHYDVVPAETDPGWQHPPFSGVVADGSVWGRGALDDKGPLVVILDAVENLLSNGVSPSRDVYLSFGGNEETFGNDAAAVAELFASRGIVPWIVVDEGGAVVDAPLPFIPVQSAMVGVGEKGIATVRLTASSSGGHASAPPTTSGASRLAEALLRAERNPFRVAMPVPVREMFRAFEPRVSFRTRLLLRALRVAHPIVARVFAARGGEPAALVRTTVVATMLAGGAAANVLPPSMSATLNLRIALGESVDSTMATLRTAIADDSIEIELVDGSEPSPLSPTDGEQFALIASTVAAVFPDAVTAPYVMMAATDSRHLHRVTPTVYRFSPLEMDAAQRASIHGVNERVAIESLHRGVQFFEKFIRAL